MGAPLDRLRPVTGHFEKHLAIIGIIGLISESNAVVCVLLINFD
jgi:hypothetical protein